MRISLSLKIFVTFIISCYFHYRINHPIKRFKTDNSNEQHKNKNSDLNLYAGHDESNLPNSIQNKPNYLMQDIKSEAESLWKNCDEQQKSNSVSSNASGMKENKNEIESDKISTDNLFTSEGLQPSYADLNKIFDNSDDNSNDDHVRCFYVC